MPNPEIQKAFTPMMLDTVERIRVDQKNLALIINRLNESIGNHNLKEGRVEKADKEEIGEIERLNMVLNKLEAESAANLHDLDDYMNKCLGPVEPSKKH